MLPDEQSLAETFKDRPFVLLGINSDPQDKAKKAIEREKITWRSWWDGGNSSGPIAATWNVNAWPTTYILDHKGIIRFRYSSRSSEAELAKNIDQLLLELRKP
jgi:peroxiredoxin